MEKCGDRFWMVPFFTNHNHSISSSLATIRQLPRYEASPHIPEHCPFKLQTKLLYVIFDTFSPSLPALYSSPPPPPYFYRPTPNHLHSYVPNAQTISICHASPPQPRSEHPKNCTRLHFLSFRDTPHHTLCSHQAMQIFSLHCPCLSPVCIYILHLDTS